MWGGCLLVVLLLWLDGSQGADHAGTPPSRRVLVVGAGFSGAVVARRLADQGHLVHVIDERDHFGGDAYDFVMSDMRVNKYGPRTFQFRSKLTPAYCFLSLFTTWRSVILEARSYHNKRFVPARALTFRRVFGVQLNSTHKAILEHVLQEKPSAASAAYDHPRQRCVDTIHRLLAKHSHSRALPAVLGARVPIYCARQMPSPIVHLLPAKGYTQLFENILEHSNIEVRLNTSFAHHMLPHYAQTVYTGSIDRFFNYSAGPLPYLSLDWRIEERQHRQPFYELDYPFDRVPCTRDFDIGRLMRHPPGRSGLVARECPCSAGGAPSYPIPTPENRRLHRQYAARAAAEWGDVTFLGRLGEYRYLNMDVAVEKALEASDRVANALANTSRSLPLVGLHYRLSTDTFTVRVPAAPAVTLVAVPLSAPALPFARDLAAACATACDVVYFIHATRDFALPRAAVYVEARGRPLSWFVTRFLHPSLTRRYAAVVVATPSSPGAIDAVLEYVAAPAAGPVRCRGPVVAAAPAASWGCVWAQFAATGGAACSAAAAAPCPAPDAAAPFPGFRLAADPAQGHVLVAMLLDRASLALAYNVTRAWAAAAPGLDFVFFSFEDVADIAPQWLDGVTIVTAQAHMKWWFFKRFLTPAVTASYRYLLLMDSDVASAPEFPIGRFLSIFAEQQFAVAQPAVLPQGRSTIHKLLHPVPNVTARWTTYVECGPFNCFQAAAWAQVWQYLKYDRSIGWGLDHLWCSLLARSPSGRRVAGQAAACGVVDATPILHNGPSRARAKGIALGHAKKMAGVNWAHNAYTLEGFRQWAAAAEMARRLDLPPGAFKAEKTLWRQPAG